MGDDLTPMANAYRIACVDALRAIDGAGYRGPYVYGLVARAIEVAYPEAAAEARAYCCLGPDESGK